MTSQFLNYEPIQGLIGEVVTGIISVEESISESSEIIDPETVIETISESPVVTIT